MGAPDDFIIISSSFTLGTGDIPWNSPTIFWGIANYDGVILEELA